MTSDFSPSVESQSRSPQSYVVARREQPNDRPMLPRAGMRVWPKGGALIAPGSVEPDQFVPEFVWRQGSQPGYALRRGQIENLLSDVVGFGENGGCEIDGVHCRQHAILNNEAGPKESGAADRTRPAF